MNARTRIDRMFEEVGNPRVVRYWVHRSGRLYPVRDHEDGATQIEPERLSDWINNTSARGASEAIYGTMYKLGYGRVTEDHWSNDIYVTTSSVAIRAENPGVSYPLTFAQLCTLKDLAIEKKMSLIWDTDGPVGAAKTRVLYEPEPELAEGMFKNMAMAGLMGLSSLRGATAPEPAQQRANQADKPVATQTARRNIVYTVKLGTRTHSMTQAWCGKTFELKSLGSGPDDIPFSALKPGMVIQFKNMWVGAPAGHWGEPADEFTMHRITAIKGNRVYTKGDDNEYPDATYRTPQSIKGVVVGIVNPDANTRYNIPVPTGY